MIRDTSETDIVSKKLGPRFTTRLKIIFGVVLAGAVTTVLYAFPQLSAWSEADRSVSAERIRTAIVSRGRFEDSISAQGKVIAATRPTLYSLADGAVFLKVRAGDSVSENEIVAVVDDPDLHNRLLQEQTVEEEISIDLERLQIAARQKDLANAQEKTLFKLELNAATRHMGRMDETYPDGLVSKEDYENAQDRLASARASYEHALERHALESETLDFEIRSKELELARQELITKNLARQVADLEVRSPVDGVVGNLVVEERENVSRNQALMTVINLSEYALTVQIPENYSDQIAVDLTAEINLQGETYPGLVAAISPEVEGGYVEGRIEFVDAVPGSLRQSQRANVTIVLNKIEDTLKLKRGPYLEEGGGRKVYVVEDGLARVRNIKTGAIGLSEVQVLEGLTQGEEVIVSTTAAFKGAETVLLN